MKGTKEEFDDMLKGEKMKYLAGVFGTKEGNGIIVTGSFSMSDKAITCYLLKTIIAMFEKKLMAKPCETCNNHKDCDMNPDDEK